MVPSICLSYSSLKCIVASLNYNTRLQLAVQCPSFITAQKTTPAKIKHLLITKLRIEIDKTTYRLELVRHAGILYIQLLTTNHNSTRIERLVYDDNWKKGMDYLIQRLIEFRPPGGSLDHWNPRDNFESLFTERLLVKSLEFGNDLYTYPMLNTAEKLTIIEEISAESLHLITRPRVYFHVSRRDPYNYAALFLRFCRHELTHQAHYSFEFRGPTAYWLANNMFRQVHGRRNKRIPGGNECYGLNSSKTDQLEVNVYTTERRMGVDSKYSIEILVCPRGYAIPI